MAKFNYFETRERRFMKLTPQDQEDLVFDLINAFALVNTPFDCALLIRDLLTEDEVMNLAKRLRIAKLLLSGEKNEEIVKELHCSFATVTKVRIWLANAGDGLRHAIKKLPKRREVYIPKRTPGIGYGLPNIILHSISVALKEKEKKRFKEFLENLRSKTATDRDFREEVNLEFRELKAQKHKVK